eukprot:8734492-Pyramimonas_sp.AAC.1
MLVLDHSLLHVPHHRAKHSRHSLRPAGLLVREVPARAVSLQHLLEQLCPRRLGDAGLGEHGLARLEDQLLPLGDRCCVALGLEVVSVRELVGI